MDVMLLDLWVNVLRDDDAAFLFDDVLRYEAFVSDALVSYVFSVYACVLDFFV